MAATIKVDDFTATIYGYKWHGDQILVSVLNTFLDPDGPPAYDPNPDATMAKDMAERFKGKVIEVDETEIATDGVN
jgi:hypothetical protein